MIKILNKLNHNPWFFSSLFMFIGIIFIIILYLILHKNADNNYFKKCQIDAITRYNIAKKSFESHLNEINAIRRFFKSSENVEEDEFKNFVQPILKEVKGCDAVLYYSFFTDKSLTNIRNSLNELLSKDSLRKLNHYLINPKNSDPIIIPTYKYFENGGIESINLKKFEQWITHNINNVDFEEHQFIIIKSEHKIRTEENSDFFILAPIFKQNLDNSSILTGILVWHLDIETLYRESRKLIPVLGFNTTIYSKSKFSDFRIFIESRDTTKVHKNLARIIFKVDYHLMDKIMIDDSEIFIDLSFNNNYFFNNYDFTFLLIIPLGLAFTIAGSFFVFFYVMKARQLSNALYRFKNLSDFSSDCIIEIDIDFRIVYINSMIFEIIENKNALIQNKSIADIFDYTNVITKFKLIDSFTKRKPFKNFELQIFVNGDKTKYLEMSAVPFYEDNSIFQGYHAVLRDITEKTKISMAVIESEQKLKELNTVKDKFFSIIAHDLINPVGNFKNISTFIVNNWNYLTSDEILEYSKEIKHSAKLLFELLNGLLLWSRSQRGKINFQPVDTDISYLINNEIDLNHYLLKNKNITLINDIANGYVVNCDINLISTVVRNLLVNAIKFCHRNGSIRISIKDLKDKFEVNFEDNGIGMTEIQLDNLFKIQVKSSTPGTENEQGTGLGLIVCHEFITMHGEKIYARSKPGHGTTMSFTLQKAMI